MVQKEVSAGEAMLKMCQRVSAASAYTFAKVYNCSYGDKIGTTEVECL